MVVGDSTDTAAGSGSYSAAGDKVYTLKFVLAGSPGVGKTRLASLFHKKHDDGGYPSVGMQFATRTLRCGQHSCVRAQMWDTAGNFPLKCIEEAYFQGAVGAMLVYDISRRSTFDDLARWLALVRDNCHKSVALILVGNKSDMSSKQREVSMIEGIRFARKHGLDFLETSALEAEHVEEACRQLIMSVARYLPKEKWAWSKQNSSYPLPAGWVPIATVIPSGDSDSDAGSRHQGDEVDEENSPPRPAGHSIKGTRAKKTDAVVVEQERNRNKRKSVDDDVDVEYVENTDVDTESDSTDADAAMMPPPPRPLPPQPPFPSAGCCTTRSSIPAASGTVGHGGSGGSSGSAAADPRLRRRGPAGGPPRAFAGGNYGNRDVQNQHQHQHARRVVGLDSFSASASGSAASKLAAFPRPPGVPKSKENIAVDVRSPPRKLLLFENTWTGERVSQRPLYPAGPSEACVVSQVPRVLDPRSFLDDPGKTKGKQQVGGRGGARGFRGEASRDVVGGSSSWSFSGLRSKGYAAAAEYLTKCVDP
ncbi:unnamed protein product [Pylaiella littoralis]